ncbi:MAG: flagellar hook-length control protein FliK [Deltaproteobacteria bacterium]|nr:flagellar hook-length control protein FliK [Deltaproteobacteria bacterium]
MKIVAAPTSAREGPAPKKAPAEVADSFLGPLAKVLIELATQAGPQPRLAPAGGGSAEEPLAQVRVAPPGMGRTAGAGPLLASPPVSAEMELGGGPGREAGADGSHGGGDPSRPFELAEAFGAAVRSAEAHRGDASPERPAADAAADVAPAVETTSDPEASLPAPAAPQGTLPAAEAALVGLYTSAGAASPMSAGLSVSSHVASLHRESAPGAAPSEGLPTIHEAAVLKTVAAGREAARVEVQHPELGAIQLDLRLDRGSMDLHAVTTSAASAIALRASESALRTSVALAGVELRGMRVDVAGDPERSIEARKKRRGGKRSLDTEA